MPITLDPSAAAIAKIMKESGRPAIHTLLPPQARAQFAGVQAAVQSDPPHMQSVENMRISTSHGEIPLRVYIPLTLPQGITAAGLVFYHGGGWVLGDLESHDAVCKQIAARAGIVVVAVDYRLAPEHKFPAAVDDCIAATAWVAQNATSLGIDPDKLLVGGDSAGGNLAAVVAIHARDHAGPRIAAQLLVYPVTDLAMDTPSHSDPEAGVSLTHEAMRWFCDHYLADQSEIGDWRLSPLKAPSLENLPPAFVSTCGADPLHDEGEEFARRLRDAGNLVVHSDYRGQFHGLLNMGRVIPEADKLLDEVADWLRQRAI